MRKLQFLFEAGAFYDQIFALLFESAIVLSVLYHLQKRLMNPHIRVEFRVEGEGHLVFVFYTDDPLFHNREHFHAIPTDAIYGARINVIGTVPMPATCASVWKLPN